MANTNSLDLERSSTQYASISDASQTGLDLSGDFTLEAWIKFETLPSVIGSTVVILSKVTTGGVQESYEWQVTTADKMQLFFSKDGTEGGSSYSLFLCDTAFASAGVWYHAAVTVTAATPAATFYIDGVAKTDTETATNATTVFNSTSDFAIGARGGGDTSYFDGLLDEVRVWNAARTATQISNNYRVEIEPHANLKGYWKLNGDYVDSSANNNQLAATGSPVFSTDIPFVSISQTTYGFFM